MWIAVAQTPGTALEEWQATLGLIREMIRDAAARGAELVVLPECVFPAYCIGSARAYWAAREAGLPGPEQFLGQLCGWAAESEITVCAGHVAEDGDRLRNTATVVLADGRVAGARDKSFLWAFDNDYFTAGERIEPVETPCGRLGVMICADARLPEIAATLAAKGVELIVQPTGWVNGGTREEPWNPQPDFLIAARALEHGVPIASASKWGRELDTDFVGSSLICDGEGHVVAQCGRTGTDLVLADVEPGRSRRPVVTDLERERLLSDVSPTLPREDVRALRVVFTAGEESDERVGCRPVEPMLVIRRTGRSRAAGQAAPLVDGLRLELCGRSADAIDLAGIRIVACDAEELVRFAAARVAALEGAHLLVAFDGGVAEDGVTRNWEALWTLSRARACENRVFVVLAGRDGWLIGDPNGRLAGCGTWSDARREPGTELEVGSSASKTVTDRTDMVCGRRPAIYRF